MAQCAAPAHMHACWPGHPCMGVRAHYGSPRTNQGTSSHRGRGSRHRGTCISAGMRAGVRRRLGRVSPSRRMHSTATGGEGCIPGSPCTVCTAAAGKGCVTLAALPCCRCNFHPPTHRPAYAAAHPQARLCSRPPTGPPMQPPTHRPAYAAAHSQARLCSRPPTGPPIHPPPRPCG
eukprot:366290-Chlamydomonas_euryale.AAC.11